MFKGFYSVATGMIAQQRRTEMYTNNLANANTPGFKADQSSLRAFPEMLLKQMGQETIPTQKGLNLPFNKTIGPINTGVYVQEAMPSFVQGDIYETQQKTDMALIDVNLPTNEENGTRGAVFYSVQGPDGQVRYTRNGDFTLDASGFLTTASGHYVLNDQGNPIQLSSDQFSINEEGQILDPNGTTSRIGIAYSNNPMLLIKEGDGLFRTEDGNALANAYNANGVQFKLQQGFLERSNVDVSRTMTDMMTAYRAFEANQKVLQAYDRSMEKAANEIGRIG